MAPTTRAAILTACTSIAPLALGVATVYLLAAGLGFWVDASGAEPAAEAPDVPHA